MSYTIFRDQKSFMRYFGQEPGPQTASLYYALCREEFQELAEAFTAYEQTGGEEDTVVEIADACLDLIYVATGLMHALKLDPQPLWDEVHRSNIDKIKHPCTACGGTGRAMAADGHGFEETTCQKCGGQGHIYEVRRREDGKVLKPEGWRPPELAALVKLMRGEA